STHLPSPDQAARADALPPELGGPRRTSRRGTGGSMASRPSRSAARPARAHLARCLRRGPEVGRHPHPRTGEDPGRYPVRQRRTAPRPPHPPPRPHPLPNPRLLRRVLHRHLPGPHHPGLGHQRRRVRSRRPPRTPRLVPPTPRRLHHRRHRLLPQAARGVHARPGPPAARRPVGVPRRHVHQVGARGRSRPPLRPGVPRGHLRWRERPGAPGREEERRPGARWSYVGRVPDDPDGGGVMTTREDMLRNLQNLPPQISKPWSRRTSTASSTPTCGSYSPTPPSSAEPTTCSPPCTATLRTSSPNDAPRWSPTGRSATSRANPAKKSGTAPRASTSIGGAEPSGIGASSTVGSAKPRNSSPPDRRYPAHRTHPGRSANARQCSGWRGRLTSTEPGPVTGAGYLTTTTWPCGAALKACSLTRQAAG